MHGAEEGSAFAEFLQSWLADGPGSEQTSPLLRVDRSILAGLRTQRGSEAAGAEWLTDLISVQGYSKCKPGKVTVEVQLPLDKNPFLYYTIFSQLLFIL